MVAMDGHEGPKEIGVQPEFLAWLTDPVKNGAGALFDFGCYGANLMTWLMDDQRPTRGDRGDAALQAGRSIRRVDDEATILVEYPGARAIIQASWNWPFGRKDLEVYGETGYAIATGGGNAPCAPAGGRGRGAPGAAAPRRGARLDRVPRRGRPRALKPAGLSSLENNLVVTEILDAARESARTGKSSGSTDAELPRRSPSRGRDLVAHSLQPRTLAMRVALATREAAWSGGMDLPAWAFTSLTNARSTPTAAPALLRPSRADACWTFSTRLLPGRLRPRRARARSTARPRPSHAR